MTLMPESSPPGTSTDNAAPALELVASRHFTDWLGRHCCSLAFTTYQAGKLFLIGLQPDGRLSVFERTFSRCLGLWAGGRTLWMSSLYQLWRFEDVLDDGQDYRGHDRLYIPRVSYVTGDLDIHDVAVDATGQPVFVNTLFGCLATVSDTHNFTPLWKPPFISRLAAEDRCHLNGLAMDDGKPCYVTAVARTDVADGWRDRRRDGGVVLSVPDSEVVCEGLSMPHSPRLHQGKLWVLNSGAGELGYVDVASGKFVPIAFCPGYLRGLAFSGGEAIVGLSLQRENRTFQGLPLDENLKSRGADARCGLCVVDLATGEVAHWLRIEGVVRELYDVVLLLGVRSPAALGFKSDEIQRTLRIGNWPE